LTRSLKTGAAGPHHTELYASRSGKITLESEIADDTWTPEDGFSMIEPHAKGGND
jgi:hypothetical protein